jgi:hypothetical protein
VAGPAIKTGKRNPYDNSSGPFVLDLQDVIDLVAPERDAPLLSILGLGASADEIASASIGTDTLDKPCTSFKHSWLNDTLVPSTGTLLNAHVAADGALDVGTTEIYYFRVNDIVMVANQTAAPNEISYFLVTAVTTGTGILTVSVISNDQAAAAASVWTLIGNAQKVGASISSEGKHTILVQTDNYTQIFQDEAVVTGSDQSVEQYGIEDPMGREIEKTFERLIVQFEKACTFGLRSSSIPSDSTTASRMGGLWYYLRVASGGLTHSLAGAAITEKALDDMIQTVWAAGGVPDTILCNTVMIREMRKFLKPFVQTTRAERTAGLMMDRYESAIGIGLDVVLDRHLGNGDLVIVTRKNLGVGPLKGNGESRHFTAAEVPWDGGDYRRAVIRGEYTMEVKNYKTNHLWAYGGATTVSS